MATTAQNKDFTNALLPNYLLDEAIEWIAHNLEPEDVFSPEKLNGWAKDSGWTHEG